MNKYEEAIKVLKRVFNTTIKVSFVTRRNGKTVTTKAFKIAIEACEKQIAKRPERRFLIINKGEVTERIVARYICKHCLNEVGVKDSYCKWCGQNLGGK